MAEVPGNTSNNFVKSLFWLTVLFCLFGALILASLWWYYRPTIEWAQ